MEGFTNPLLIRLLWRISALIPSTSHTLNSAGGFWALGSLLLLDNDLTIALNLSTFFSKDL